MTLCEENIMEQGSGLYSRGERFQKGEAEEDEQEDRDGGAGSLRFKD